MKKMNWNEPNDNLSGSTKRKIAENLSHLNLQTSSDSSDSSDPSDPSDKYHIVIGDIDPEEWRLIYNQAVKNEDLNAMRLLETWLNLKEDEWSEQIPEEYI